jgi:hypothetical protein
LLDVVAANVCAADNCLKPGCSTAGMREAFLFFIRAFWPAFVVDALVIAMMVRAAS